MMNVSDDTVRELLGSAKTIAVVGASPDPVRPSHEVAAYLQRAGYHIVPVNPTVEALLGEKSYSSVRDIPFSVDIVDIFRKPEQVLPIVEDSINKGVKTIWMQEEVVNREAYDRAVAAGLNVIMNKCILKIHRSLIGGR